MLRFLLVRLIQAVVTLLVASIVVFLLARVTGNPADLLLPIEATPDERAAIAHEHGWDRPLLYQYWRYLGEVFRGDFGTSFRTKVSNAEIVMGRLVNSLKLAGASMAFSVLLAFPLGILAAQRRGSYWDRMALVVALLGQSVPPFFTGILLILIFVALLGWLPTAGLIGWKSYILPAVAIGWSVTAGIVRLLRSSMLEVLDSEYVKLARIKGLRESVVVWKHAARNALIPVITFIGFMYGIILAAAITVEVVFNWPGLGRLSHEATMWRDFPLLQLTVLVWVLVVIIVNFIVDLMYMVLDPRIRLT